MLPQQNVIARTARAIVFGALAGLVIGTTWLYGGALTEHQVWFAAAAIVVVLASAVICTVEPHLSSIPWLTGVLAAAIALGASQLIPLSESSQSSLTPTALELRHQLQGQMNTNAPNGNAPISLYPGSTRRDLARLILPVAVFVASVIPLGAMPWQRAFCWLLTGHGMSVALFGIVQQLTFNGKLFWTVTLTQGGTPFASFVNRNHAAAYLNLCLAAVIALVVWEFRRRTEEAEPVDDTPLAPTSPWRTRLTDQISDRVASLTGSMLFLMIAAVVIVAAILCTGSRGGIAAMFLAGAAVTALMTFRHLHTSIGILVITAGIGVAMTSWVGQGESVAGRLEELGTDLRQAASSRWNHWRQSVSAVPDFWMTGTGLGTYRYIYPLYQSESLPAWYYHAENQYLEAIVEAGIPGLLLMLAAIGLALYYSIRKITTRRADWPAALGLAGTFAVLTAALQAGVDFNLYMPANAVTLAILVAMQVAMPSDTSESDVRTSTTRRFGWLLCLLLTAGAVMWSLSVLRNAAQVEKLRRDWERNVESLVREEAIVDDRMRALANRVGGDADAYATVASMYLWKYRLNAWETLVEELGESANAELLWESTDPLVLHRQLHETSDGPTVMSRFPALYENIQQASDWYQQALRQCPLRASYHLALARIAPLVAPEDGESRYLQQAVQTAPADPHVLFQAGRLAYQAGERSRAMDWWNRSLLYSDRRLVAILRLVDGTDEAVLLQEYETLFAGLPQRAVEAVHTAARTPALRARVPLLAQVAWTIIDVSQLEESDRHYLLGRVARLSNQTDVAIDHLEQAVSARPERFPWRAELVETLLTAERYPEAYRHARICSDGNPKSAAYRQLLQRASRQLGERTKSD